MTQDPPSLFEVDDAARPLADRLRPKALTDVVGQEHLLPRPGPIARMIDAHRLASMVLWGPPGCGKTTIARLLAERADLVFEHLSATFSGVADLRKVFRSHWSGRRPRTPASAPQPSSGCGLRSSAAGEVVRRVPPRRWASGMSRQ